MNGQPPNAFISMITLGVSDLARSCRFYQKLGWQDSPHSQEGVAFLQGNNIVLGLYGHEALGEDAGGRVLAAPPCAVALAINLATPGDVDTYHQKACKAGATAIKSPQAVFWGGYSGYFGDPDGHLWEVAHNPFFQMTSDGRIDLFEEAGHAR